MEKHIEKRLKVLYCRVSGKDQNLDSQKGFNEKYDLILEDQISGIKPIFLREGGSKIKQLICDNVKFDLYVSFVDRLGRNSADVLTFLETCVQKKINVFFFKQNLKLLDENYKENFVDKFTISILASVSEFSRLQMIKNTRLGIETAKIKNPELYSGRKKGTKENLDKFLSKPKNSLALSYIKEGNLTLREISEISGLHVNTLTKIKKIWKNELESKNTDDIILENLEIKKEEFLNNDLSENLTIQSSIPKQELTENNVNNQIENKKLKNKWFRKLFSI